MVDISTNAMNEAKDAILERTKTYPLSRQFNMRLVKPDTWVVTPYSPSTEVPCPHVLIGKEYALVIDPTDTPFNIRKYVEECVTDKPLKVANSHSHGDHTTNNGLFDDCEIFMSELAWEEIKKSREPGGSWDTHKLEEKGYVKGDYVPTIVRPGDVIDLGEREIEVLGVKPCHSPTSLLYLDRTYGILFPGDEIDDGQINMWGVPVETFKQNIEMLIERRDKGDFDMICSPHNGSPVHAKVLDYYLENCNRIMSGIEGSMDKGSTSYLLNPFENRGEKGANERRWDPYTRRSEWMGTNINYNIDLIYNSQLEGFVAKGVTAKLTRRQQ